MMLTAQNTRRLWWIHAIWGLLLLTLQWLIQNQIITARILTLAVALAAGQVVLLIPIVLQRAQTLAIVALVFVDSALLIQQALLAPAGVGPVYIGLALVPTAFVAYWRPEFIAAPIYWIVLALIDVVLRSNLGEVTLSLTNPALLTWAGLLPIVGVIVLSNTGARVPTTTEQAEDDIDDEYRTLLIETSGRLSVATSPDNALDVALEAIGPIVETGTTARVIGFALTFSRVDLDEFVTSATYNTDRSWKGRHMPIQGIVHESLMSGEITRTEADDILAENFPAVRDRWVLLLPLYTRLEVYGVIVYASRRELELTQKQLHVIEAITNNTSQMLRIHHLQGELERSRREILLDEEDTRHQLARDLHDGPVQQVSAISMQLDFIKKLFENEPENVLDEIDATQKAVQQATQQLRTFMFGLRPVVLETEGLVPALEQYTRRLRTRDNLNVELDADTVPRLESTVEQNTFAIVREAVLNAKKHADDAPIKISLEMTPAGLRSVVSDKGPGFDLESVERGYGQRASLGLLNMKERAEMIDGFLEIRTAPGEGTDIELFVPTRDRVAQ